jgi:hypothetical protein
MITKAFTPFSGVQPFAIMGFTGKDGAGMGHGLLVRSSGMRVNVQRGREPDGDARAERRGPLTHETAIRDISADSG